MIGRAVLRTEGALKVTGRAVYSYERQDVGAALYGVIVGSEIGKGRIRRIETSAAETTPGVVLVMTYRNAPPQGSRDNSLTDQFGRPRPVFVGAEVEYFGQPIAFVVADSFEQARAAAALIEVAYLCEPGKYELAAHKGSAYAPAVANAGLPGLSAVGDLETALAGAAVQLDETYTTPHHVAHPMEPAACLASWEGQKLTVYVSVQMIGPARMALARTLLIEPEHVHVDAAFVGGGFGSKLRIHDEVVLAALAARELCRPVKVAQARRQVAALAGHRPEMIHRVRLAADQDGRLSGLGHEVNMQGATQEEFVEQAATVVRPLYAAPHRLTRHWVSNLDVKLGEPVRGPGEVPGLLAIESAMDELAFRLDIDPIELRIRNEPTLDPERNVPFSARRLVECMRDGAARFGWNHRVSQPGARREGDLLVGLGMAAMIRKHAQGATRAVVRIEPEGRVVVRSDMTDLGTGTTTILAQVAVDALGVPLNKVTVELARSDLPVSAGSGGSWGASNTSSAVHLACEALKEKLGGRANREGRWHDLADEVAQRFPDGIEGEGSIPGAADEPRFQRFSQHSYGASFAEVAVDIVSGEVRLRRMLGVFSAGRILNPTTARAQLVGGMIWGVSSALLEAAIVDPRYGNFVNPDLAEYFMPVHADIPNVQAVMLEDEDRCANLLGVKGVGELGICGSGAAVANAVFNATGVRVRDFPITVDKLLLGLPALRH